MTESHPDKLQDDRRGIGPLFVENGDPYRPLRQQVFECVRSSGLIPRVQVAKDLGVSPASVTSVAAELIQSGLIEEVATSRDEGGVRGRPAVALGVRPSAFYVAGLKISDREHSAVIVDSAGNLIANECIISKPGSMQLHELLGAIDTLLDAVCARAGMERQDLSGLGLGIPGFVDYQAGIVFWSSVLSERQVRLAEAASKHLQIAVWVDNDANLVALAELWFGEGRGLTNFAVVTIEHGVGMGFVMGRNIYRGTRRLGMELGHTKVHLDGALCRCGQRGCLEAYVADYALVREATTALNWGDKTAQPVHIMLESLFDHAKAGNVTARSIFRRAGRYLAVGLSNVINLFDPALIILSGERMRYDYLYARETLAEMDMMMIDTGRPRTPPVHIHAWGDLLWAHGAAALALSETSERLLAINKDVAAQ